MDTQLTDEQIANLTPEQVTLLDEDPSKIAEVLAEMDKATEGTPKQEEQDGATNGAGDEDEPVVLNKSGKGTIPYSTVKDLRADKATLREQLDEANAKLAAVEKLNALNQEREDAATPEEAEAAEAAIAAHLENVREDMPELHQVMNHVHTATKRLDAKVARIEQQLTQEKEKVEREQKLTVEEQVAEAKENNPDLVHWESKDPAAWDEALRQDEVLRMSATWAKKPYGERFDEVVRRVRALMPDATQPPKQADPDATKAKAKATLEKVPVRKPTTLSDIQGGANPASESEQFNNLDPFEMARKLTKLTPQQAAVLRADLD